MRRSGGRAVAVVAVAGTLLVAACSGSKPQAEPRVTVPQPTTTTDPYAPPPVIDAAYVNRVLAGLDQVVGDAVRKVVRNRAFTPEAEEYLRAAYSDEGDSFANERDGLKNEAKAGLVGARPNPGNKVTTVSRLLSARTDCIFAQVQRDYSAVAYAPGPEGAVQWVGLKPVDTSRDPAHLNPTHWMYVYDRVFPDHTQPPDQCARP